MKQEGDKEGVPVLEAVIDSQCYIQTAVPLLHSQAIWPGINCVKLYILAINCVKLYILAINCIKLCILAINCVKL